LQVPFMTDGAKYALGGTVAPGSGCVASAPLIATALLASMMPLGAAAFPVVAHVAKVPMAPGAIEADVPIPSCIAPSAVAGVAIVPGAGASVVVVVAGNEVVMGDDKVPSAGAFRIEVGPTRCAKLGSQPNMAMAAVMNIKLRIGTSCV
jgi:hypothetical protein